MERIASTAGTRNLGADLFYVPANGATPAMLTAASRKAIQGKIFRAVSPEFREDIQNAADAALDTGLVQVDPVVVVTGGNLLKVRVRLAPRVKGYLLELDLFLSIQE
jgi:hypothetical protein